VCYRLSEENELIITYHATTDIDTVINLTNHSYFNLNGQDGSAVTDRTLQLNSSSFTECDAETVPTGRILPVTGTPLDFRAGKKPGLEMHADFDQTRMCRGYDHNYVLDCDGSVREFAVLKSDKIGICMRCSTDQPGVQLCSGIFINSEGGKGGFIYPTHGGVCLETQHYPCSPGFPQFPSTVLKPGEEYNYTTVYRFSSF